MAKTTKQVEAIGEQSLQQLHELAATKRADLLGYKKGLAAGELKNTGVIKSTRKEIARINTAIAGKEGDK